MMTKNPVLPTVLAALLLSAAMPSAVNAWPFGQRQANPPVVLAQSPDAAARLNRVEEQMRNLTGQVEQLAHQVQQLQDQLQRMQEDTDFRLRELEGGGGAAPAPRTEITPPPDGAPDGSTAMQLPDNPQPAPSQTPDAIGSIASQNAEQGLGAPPEPLGTLTLDQPIDLTAPPTQPSGPDVASVAPSGDPRADYERAYNLILNGDYAEAEAAFRQFLATYPDDVHAPDAQYWLGESYFVRAEFREAANEFLAGYKNYPSSEKAPDTLLKLGLSLAGLGEREAACSTFAAVLREYPDVSNSLQQRIQVEQASANC